MTVKDVVEMYRKEHELSKAELARRLGVAKGNLHNALNHEDGMNIQLSTLLKWLEKMDCQLVVDSIDADEEWILDGEDESWTYED